MSHQLVIFPNGTASVRPEGTEQAEAMHSSIGPWREANLLYVEQSRLAARLRAAETGAVVVYDVGMGIAANALAAIACARGIEASARRALHVVSFERDLDGLRVAREHAERFPFLAGFEGALDALTARGRWDGTGVTWELRAGDFRAHALGDPEPELVFYDFYSPRSLDAELWGHASFVRLHAACSKRRDAGLPVVLSTYSSATPVRAALLLSGFFVGRGVGTGEKHETTVAATRLEDLERPLGREWLAKLGRSSKPAPRDWGPERTGEAKDAIARHPQFAKAAEGNQGQ